MSHVLQKFTDICCLLFYSPLDIFAKENTIVCANKHFVYIFNGGEPL